MVRERFEEPVNTAWRRLPEYNLQQAIIIDARASTTVGVVGQQVQRPVWTLNNVSQATRANSGPARISLRSCDPRSAATSRLPRHGPRDGTRIPDGAHVSFAPLSAIGSTKRGAPPFPEASGHP